MKHDAETLKELLALPLSDKVAITEDRIVEWYEHYDGHVVISFSGGKDSTVLLHIARRLFPDIKAVFSNTGLEYPEIQAFVRTFDNVDIVRPAITFKDVLTQYGYPLVSKEVADAIYYARRNGGAERVEQARKSTPQNVQWGAEPVSDIRISSSKRMGGASAYRKLLTGQYRMPSGNNGNSSPGITTLRKQRKLLKQREATGSRSNSPDSTGTPQTARSYWKQIELTGQYGNPYQRGGGVTETETASRKPGYGGEYKTGTASQNPGYGGLSQFNKDKWLPLVYTPFNVSAYCCNVMKKSPMHKYQRTNKVKPIIGTMTSESRTRKQAWIRTGCNAFDSSDPKSTPMAFWTEDDVLAYAKREGIDLCKVYGEIVCDGDCTHCHTTGLHRTGCVFCLFGAHNRNDSRLLQLAEIQPRLYEYCLNGGQWIDNPAYIEGLSEEPNDIGWIAWNPRKIWVPSSQGLGMRYVIDCVNAIYGPNTIKY